ncbi:MAG TPA: MlaD family protein [Gammaproteobacteria bacterium]|nr:MlaD family protein [Gammaproteobacteria bacterium]
MKSDRINYLVVGSFVIAMIAGLTVAIALLTGRTGATDTYFTSYRDATGLKFGSQVLYMGYPVGQVEEITPVVENGSVSFRVRLEVSEDFKNWQVPRDSVAQIRAAGLLAAVTIDIRSGESKETLEPGDHLPGREQSDVFVAVTDAANTLKFLTENSIKPLIENLHAYVTSFGSVIDERGGDLISNLSILSGELATRSPELISKFIELSDELKHTSAQFRAVLSEDNAQKVGAVVDNMVTASRNAVSLTEDTRQQIHALLGPGTSRKVDDALQNISTASGNIARLSDDVNERLRGILTPETAQKMQRALDNFSLAAANIATLSRDLGATRAELDRLLAALSKGVDENRPNLRDSSSDLRYILRSVAQNIDAVNYNLEGTSRNMFEFSRLLRQDPSVLIRGSAAAEDAATQTGIAQ